MRRMAGCSGMPASSSARRRPPRTPSTRRCRSCRHDHRCADGMPGQLLCTAVRTTAHELLELGRGRRRTSCACDVGAPWIQRGAPEGRERTRESCSMIYCTSMPACVCVQCSVCLVRHRLRRALAEPSACACTLLLACVWTCPGRPRASREPVPRGAPQRHVSGMLCTPRGEKRPPRGNARGNQGPTQWRLLIVIKYPRGGRTYMIAPRADVDIGRTYRRKRPIS